jgi:phosphate transport system permease protein
MRTSTIERITSWFMRAMTYFIVFIIAFIVLKIAWNGLPVISWDFLTTMPRKSGAEGGILPAIVGTLCLVIGTLTVALPLGMATAIYLSEYAKSGRFTRTVRLAIITLAGVPSIVFGLFGLGLFVIFLRFRASLISGCLTLACMVLPTIIVSSEEALRAVPQSLREGSLALGATRRQTIYKNVLPYSISGMLTGSILGVGRAAGETAPILLTVAAFYLPKLPKSIFDQVMALPYHLYVLATQHPDAAKVRPMQYATAFVLLVLVLGVNLVAIFLRIRIRKKSRW